jgi:hypothetical protein
MMVRRWGDRVIGLSDRLEARIKPNKKAGYKNAVDQKLDQVVGDMFTYVYSLGAIFTSPSASKRDAAKHILRRFYGQLDRAAGECDEIQVLAHSLGSVIAYHALTGYSLESAVLGSTGAGAPLHKPLRKVKQLYTIGSPLNKFKYFWPVLVTGVAPGALVGSGDHWGQERPAESEWRFRWHNFYNPLDLISGRLDDVKFWPKVENQRVWAGGLATSHVIYLRGWRLLRTLTAGLFGQSVHIRRGSLSTVRGFIQSMADSLGTLGVLLSMVAFALGALALLAFSLAWMIGSVAGLVWGDGTGKNITTWAFLTMLILLLFGSFLGGMRRAESDIAIWWERYSAGGGVQSRRVT